MSRYDDNMEFDHNGDPFMELRMNFNGNSVELRLDYETTAIFTHKEQDNHYDHIFCEMESDDTRTLGAFIWRQVLPDWEDLKRTLDNHDFQHIHSPYPSEADVEQYESTGLMPPQKFVQSESGLLVPNVIVEDEDDEVVAKAIEKLDSELDWFLEDPHYFDRRKPRDE